MMDKTEIINHIASHHLIEDLVKKMTRRSGLSQNLKDLCQDLYMDLLEKDGELIRGLWERNELERFISQMIKNNLFSYTSRYYKDYVKFSLKSEDVEEIVKNQREDEIRYDRIL